MRIRPTHFFLALILTVSFFGAGIVDTVWSDVIPLRPYDLTLRQTGSLIIGNTVQKTPLGASIGSIFTVVLVILIIASMAGTIANLTTGITIAHSGFTPNPNVTGSPGLRALVPVVPLVFIGIGIGYALDEMGGIL
jgi:hypothetical protein